LNERNDICLSFERSARSKLIFRFEKLAAACLINL